ncbi:hypothetical protein [Synechococcus phage DSL-LC03]|nr:hypothetical protein [Synechococcus phage DSL-LC03]
MLTHLQPDMQEELQDMTDYVTECLSWAQGRMVELLTEDRSDDALALGAEFLAWADETEDMIYCSPDFSNYEN